ncbi:MAG: 50S ribosomal protein L16 [Cytophagales bacterium]|nr:50S ribosomal protein L16 [Cytophagales bacterium]MDW8385235.1 50S ribosomal protein L16 [Flammeovirgaceae bacterium]
MLQPKRTKFRKQQRGRSRGSMATRGAEIAFGSFGIKSLVPGLITARQIEAARIAISRAMKREGQMWIRIFPDKPITRKPAEVRMGKGKGSPEFWAVKVKPGTILFECDGISMDLAKEALRLGAQKLPVTTKFVVRRDYVAN